MLRLYYAHMDTDGLVNMHEPRKCVINGENNCKLPMLCFPLLSLRWAGKLEIGVHKSAFCSTKDDGRELNIIVRLKG